MNALLQQVQAEAARRQETFSQAARHHMLEGLLRRLAMTSGGKDFVLRGGLLTRAWLMPRPRPTRDLDLVGDFDFSVEATEARLRPALKTRIDDGVSIDDARCSAQGIWLDSEFPGVRFTLAISAVRMAPERLTIDVGFGDPLVPEAGWFDYPALLKTPLRLRAVRPETQLSWKLHGLAEMGEAWRPKDLFDLWLITQHLELSQAALPPAIEAAFLSRHFSLDDAHVLQRPYWNTKTARVRWHAKKPNAPQLPIVLEECRGALADALANLKKERI